METETPWLTEGQQQLWRRWLRVTALMPTVLGRDLQASSGLSLQDFSVLVQLTDRDGAQVRVSDLADSLQWERSRLSHQLTRMEQRGLLARRECREDGRGAFVVITPRGREAIEEAAPGHVRAVRRLMIDRLSAADEAALDRILGAILDELEATCAGPLARPEAAEGRPG